MADLGRHPLDRVVEALSDALDQGHDISLIGLDQAATAMAIRRLGAMSARLAELTATVLRHGGDVAVQETRQARSLTTWLALETRVSPTDAHREVKLAEGLGRWHRVAEVLSTGAANVEQATVLIRALDALPDDLDAALVEKCELHLVGLVHDFGPKQLRILGRHVLTAVAPEVGEAHDARLLEDEERRAAEQCRLTMGRDGRGTVRGRFTIPELHAAMLEKALLSLTWNERDREQRAKPAAEQQGEAFCELLERLRDKDLSTVGGTGATVVVTMSVESLTGGLAEAVLDNGDRISAATARRMACEAGIIPAVLGGKSQVLDLGRTRRYHSKAQRIAIATRDHHCTAEGCDAPAARCHVHHDTPWAHGGPTTVKDGRLLCPRHHRAIHDPTRTVKLRT
jgi:hypothetical protein